MLSWIGTQKKSPDETPGKYDPLHSNEFGVIHFQMNPRPAEFDPEDVVEQVLEIAERVWQLEEGDDDDDNQTGSSRPMPR